MTPDWTIIAIVILIHAAVLYIVMVSMTFFRQLSWRKYMRMMYPNFVIKQPVWKIAITLGFCRWY